MPTFPSTVDWPEQIDRPDPNPRATSPELPELPANRRWPRQRAILGTTSYSVILAVRSLH